MNRQQLLARIANLESIMDRCPDHPQFELMLRFAFRFTAMIPSVSRW